MLYDFPVLVHDRRDFDQKLQTDEVSQVNSL